MRRSKAEIDQLLAPTAAEYADGERAAAEQESYGVTASTDFSVRLQPAVDEAVRTTTTSSAGPAPGPRSELTRRRQDQYGW
jgi:hypothetical protein